MQINILLVDDEPSIIQALKRMLRPYEWNILQANDGEEALLLLQQEHIHVLVTDFKMPRRNGISLCQEARKVSPYTYRLLISGQVDYDALRKAWHAGDVHRFVAKPWDNTLLTMDIEEGVRQQVLLQHAHNFQQSITSGQAVMLTDDNWVIRLANQPLCNALGVTEEELLGVNLFSSSLSTMPITLETEITRQTENQETWLGHFILLNQAQQQVPAWMTVSPMGTNYRLCVCQTVEGTSINSTPAKQETDSINQVKAMALHLAFDLTELTDDEGNKSQSILATTSAELFNHIKAVSQHEQELYHLPQHHCFILSAHGDPAIAGLEKTKERLLNAVDLPSVTITEQTLDNQAETYENWIRALVGIKTSAVQPTPGADLPQDDYPITPVFGLHGEIIAIESHQLIHYDEEELASWFAALISTWQSLFTSTATIIVNATEAGPDSTKTFLPALDVARRSIPIDCYIVLDEEHLLSNTQDDILWQGDLVRHDVKRMISHFGRSFLNARQILSLPIDGITLAPEFLTRLQHPKNAIQGARLLQKLHENDLLIFARNIARSELLAISHKARIDWLSGRALAPEITFQQLQWYSPEATLG